MGKSTTRHAAPRKYEACKKCPNDLPGYGKCAAGLTNFYYRRNKDNHCPKCWDEIRKFRKSSENNKNKN